MSRGPGPWGHAAFCYGAERFARPGEKASASATRGQPGTAVPTFCLVLALFWLAFAGEDFFGIHDDKDAAASGEEVATCIEDFGDVGQTAAALAEFAGFDAEGLVQRDGLDIFDGHFRGDGYDLTKFAEFAHGVIENGGDNATVAVSRLSLIHI